MNMAMRKKYYLKNCLKIKFIKSVGDCEDEIPSETKYTGKRKLTERRE